MTDKPSFLTWRWFVWAFLHIISLNYRGGDEQEVAYRRFVAHMLRMFPLADAPTYASVYELTHDSFGRNPFADRRSLAEFVLYWRNLIRCTKGKSMLTSASVLRFFESFRARCVRSPDQGEAGCHGKGPIPVSKGRMVVRLHSRAPPRVASCCVMSAGRPFVSSSLDGFNTFVWGPLAWTMLHMFSFHASQSLSWRHRRAFLLHLGKVLPCGACRENFRTNVQEALAVVGGDREEEAFSHRGFPFFVYTLHNAVNRCLNKVDPPPTFEQVVRQYAPDPNMAVSFEIIERPSPPIKSVSLQ